MVSYSVHGSLNVDGSLKKLTLDFLNKLQENPASPGLHIEPIRNSVDSRARTGRVNDQFRAVLFELRDDQDHHFVIVGVYNHDDAIKKAQNVSLSVNPVNGITRLIDTTTEGSVKEQASKPESLRKQEEAAAQAEAFAKAQQEPTPVEIALPSEIFADHGYTAELLEAELGIDPHATETVLGLSSDREISKSLRSSPPWERDALIGLAAGLSIEDVREELGISAALSEPDNRTEDAKTIAGLKLPAAQMEFAYLDTPTSEELRKVIETKDFDSWRVYIDPSQRTLVDANFSGSGRVFGGAGTGKTVVVVHRANRLSTDYKEGSTPPRVLLTTFTKGLAEALKSSANALNPLFPEAERPGTPGMWIGGIDQVTMMIIKAASRAEIEAATEKVLGRATPSVRVFNRNENEEFWDDALLASEQTDLPQEIQHPEFLSQEFESVILARSITTQKEYLRTPRPGRGTPLNRTQRKKVWEVIEMFMKSCSREGKHAWPAISAIASEILNARADNGRGRLFDHVLVDEAQDFHAGHWRFLRACVEPGPNDIFLAEDSHQRIYGQRHVLSRFGISTRGGASRRLTLNYRTTEENLNYALGMLTGEWIDAEGEEDSVEHYRSARKGPKPVLHRFETEGEEFEGIAKLIRHWQETNKDIRIGILARSGPLTNRIVSALSEDGIQAVKTQNAELAAHETISVMTMHGAKGMEFTHVVLVGMGKDLIPMKYQLEGLGEAEKADAHQRERSLLYVAASRARDELVLTTHSAPSEFLPGVSQ